jgi:cysteinyl-tRNA synthetase
MGSASRPDGARAPEEVRAAARRRSEARAARDWATADALREEIEAAGWRVIDAGTDYRLEPAHPSDEEVGGEIRYGRSDAVPSRLEEPATCVATVIVVVEADDPAATGAISAAARHLPEDADLVVVADGVGDALVGGISDLLAAAPLEASRHEVVRTSAPLGRAAALNTGVRRSRGPIVIALDPSIDVTGDVVAPLIAALEDRSVAVAGPFGLVSSDLRRFEEVAPMSDRPTDVAAVQGYLMAFRRQDAALRGPLDEAFRFYRNLDIWWSLVLRDEGEREASRRAVAVPDLPLIRREPWAWTSTPEGERERLSKRNFYRLLDRFRTRLDLAVPPPRPTID